MQQTEFRTGVIRPIECFREGWEAIKPNYWLIFVITIVGVLIGGISAYIFLGAMVCGIYYCYFRALDGESVEIQHLFRGLSFFWPSLLITILVIGPAVLLIGLIYVPLLYSTMMGAVLTEKELYTMLASALVTEFVVALVMVCLHTLIIFSFPLIVDRGLSGWQSVIISAKAVWKNLGGVTGLWAVGFVVALIGYMAFCVGIYFVIPLLLASNVAAYRKVFPKIGASKNFPPSPEEYEGLGTGAV